MSFRAVEAFRQSRGNPPPSIDGGIAKPISQPPLQTTALTWAHPLLSERASRVRGGSNEKKRRMLGHAGGAGMGDIVVARTSGKGGGIDRLRSGQHRQSATAPTSAQARIAATITACPAVFTRTDGPTRPPGIDAAALAAADQVQPLDTAGNPDPDGRIVMILHRHVQHQHHVRGSEHPRSPSGRAFHPLAPPSRTPA